MPTLYAWIFRVAVIEAREDDKGSSHSTGTSPVSTCAGNPQMASDLHRGQPSERIPDLRVRWDVAARMRMPSPAICDTRSVLMTSSGKAGFGKCAYGYDHRHNSS